MMYDSAVLPPKCASWLSFTKLVRWMILGIWPYPKRVFYVAKWDRRGWWLSFEGLEKSAKVRILVAKWGG